MTVADHYAYRVFWSAEDASYVGSVAELPSLSWLDPDQLRAFQGIRRLATEVVADLADSGESVPVPIGERIYSGKFQVRVPPELHRLLVLAAAEQGVSLNRLAAQRLAVAS